MTILSIETSCDDTAIAVIKVEGVKKPSFRILSNIIASQIQVHKKYGGVYPTLAKREHAKNLPLVLKKALGQAANPRIEAIAVTKGPGLSPCLWEGVNFAKKLAKEYGVPLIPVNHIEGHLLVSLFSGQKKELLFPSIALIVSGGNTQLILVKNIRQYSIIGETRDDAAGECFDKTARILGLEYPGGPAIAKEAELNKERETPKLPRPMLYTKDYDFSFSGLKTAVLYHHKAQPKNVQKSKKYVRAMAKEIQQAIIDVLISKTLRAVTEHRAKSVVLGGGVAANKELRKQFKEKLGATPLLVARPSLCTDNAVMIGITGYLNWKSGKAAKNPEKLSADPNFRIA